MSLIYSRLSLDLYYNVIDIILYEIFELDILYVKIPIKTIGGILFTCKHFYHYLRKEFAKYFYKKFGFDEKIFLPNCIRKNCKDNDGDNITVYCGSIWDLLNAYMYDIYEEPELPCSWYGHVPNVIFESREIYYCNYLDCDRYIDYYERMYHVKLFFYKLHDDYTYYHCVERKKINVFSLEKILEIIDNSISDTDKVVKILGISKNLGNMIDGCIQGNMDYNLGILYFLYSKLEYYLPISYKIIYILVYQILYMKTDINYLIWKELFLYLKYYLLKLSKDYRLLINQQG
ncbi:3315_t:CDS:1 [Scutellospora calospora]|uniref:3315_t:CDS:1 n=1 Tax=Scutellospora calospora TaxID=85575 RepID=A0ACA9K938_9GLOM|nr:3315_t:CDS:1 [Scutellospora calospora]